MKSCLDFSIIFFNNCLGSVFLTPCFERLPYIKVKFEFRKNVLLRRNFGDMVNKAQKYISFKFSKYNEY